MITNYEVAYLIDSLNCPSCDKKKKKPYHWPGAIIIIFFAPMKSLPCLIPDEPPHVTCWLNACCINWGDHAISTIIMNLLYNKYNKKKCGASQYKCK